MRLTLCGNVQPEHEKHCRQRFQKKNALSTLKQAHMSPIATLPHLVTRPCFIQEVRQSIVGRAEGVRASVTGRLSDCGVQGSAATPFATSASPPIGCWVKKRTSGSMRLMRRKRLSTEEVLEVALRARTLATMASFANQCQVCKWLIELRVGKLAE